MSDRDVAWVRDATTSPSVAPFTGRLYVVERDLDASPFPWSLGGDSVSPAPDVAIGGLKPSTQRNQGDSLRLVTLTVTVFDAQGREVGTWADLPVDPAHRTAGMADSVFALFGQDAAARTLPIVITATPGTSWARYDAAANIVTIHVLDLIDEQAWVRQFKGRYERLLKEIFE